METWSVCRAKAMEEFSADEGNTLTKESRVYGLALLMHKTGKDIDTILATGADTVPWKDVSMYQRARMASAAIVCGRRRGVNVDSFRDVLNTSRQDQQETAINRTFDAFSVPVLENIRDSQPFGSNEHVYMELMCGARGLRSEELASLKLDPTNTCLGNRLVVKGTHALIKLTHHKTKAHAGTRTIDMPERVARLMQAMEPEGLTCRYLFPSRDGKTHMSRQCINAFAERYYLPLCTDFRRAYETHARTKAPTSAELEAFIGRESILTARMQGHSTTTAAIWYTDAAPEQRRAAAALAKAYEWVTKRDQRGASAEVDDHA
jgi:hypothetical protein